MRTSLLLTAAVGIVATYLGAAAPAGAGVNMEVPALIVFDDQLLERPAQTYQYHGFTVYDAKGAPLRGQFLDWTATVEGVNAAESVPPFTGKLDQYGRGVFGYFALRKGLDVLTVTVAPVVGHAERTYSTPATVTVVEAAVRVEFDDLHTLRATQSYQYHGFTVYGSDNQPLRTPRSFRAVVAGVNGPTTATGTTDSSGRALFGYYAGATEGEDVLTVEVDAAVGEATRAYEASADTPGVFDAAVLEASDPRLEPTALPETPLGPARGTVWNRLFSSATEDADGVDSFFRYHGDHDWDGGHSADLDLTNGWQTFALDATARIDYGVATRARGDVGMAKQHSLRAGADYAFSAYARVRLVNVRRTTKEDLKARITIHKVVNGSTVAECNADRFATEEWMNLRIYNCGLSGGSDSVRANVRLNVAAMDVVKRDRRPAGTGTLQVDWFKFVRECVPVGACPLTAGGSPLQTDG